MKFLVNIYYLLIVYYKFFIATKKNEQLFVQQSSNGFDMRGFLKACMKTSGKNEIIIFAAYSLPLMIFFYEFEMFFTDMRVVGYFLGVLLFSAGYAVCGAIIYRRWDKKWHEEEITKEVKV